MAVEIEPTTEQIQRGLAATLAVTFYADGVVADPGVTTVTVARLDGTVIATGAATSGTGAAARTYALAAQSDLDILTVTWTSATHGAVGQTVEVVGDLLFTLRQARAFDGGALANTTTYTTDTIEQARVRITNDFARICGVSFLPRVERAVLSGCGGTELLLPQLRVTAVRSIETRATAESAWTAVAAGDLAAVRIAIGGVLSVPSGIDRGVANVRATYEHGWEQPPEQIRAAALLVLRHTVVPDDIGPRVTSLTSELGTTAYATAGRVGNLWSAFPHYGIPQVDATLARYSERVPAVG